MGVLLVLSGIIPIYRHSMGMMRTTRTKTRTTRPDDFGGIVKRKRGRGVCPTHPTPCA